MTGDLCTSGSRGHWFYFLNKRNTYRQDTIDHPPRQIIDFYNHKGYTKDSMSEITTLETKLTEHWQQTLEDAEKTVQVAEYNLGRIGLIYSGQLRLELEET